MNKKTKEFWKKMVEEIEVTPEQTDYLIDLYKDEDSIIGLHKTNQNHESFFISGLTNHNWLGQPNYDLSNTVYYSELLINILHYHQNNGSTCIVLKIPKDVFDGKQGIFEEGELGNSIPKEFIVGALRNGEIYQNPNYKKEYKSENAINAEETTITYYNKQEQIDEYKKLSKKTTLEKITEKLKVFWNRIAKKQKELPTYEEKKETKNTLDGYYVGEPNIGDRTKIINNPEKNKKREENLR